MLALAWTLTSGWFWPGDPAMCCFSVPVHSVNHTRIFARSAADGWQSLAYAMHLDVAADVAMVLPLPVAPGTGDDGMRFIDLSAYPQFFDQLHYAWPAPRSKEEGPQTPSAPTPAPPPPLPVVQVGAFDASFVPTIADFSRLEERFRLPANTWEQLPMYRSFGFAVFKLKPGKRDVHPMAFSFPRADRRSLFFPTVHIHDGAVRLKATFDHQLYCQRRPDEMFSLEGWRESDHLLGQHVDAQQAKGLIDPQAHGHLLELHGLRDNRDIILRPA